MRLALEIGIADFIINRITEKDIRELEEMTEKISFWRYSLTLEHRRRKEISWQTLRNLRQRHAVGTTGNAHPYLSIRSPVRNP